MEGPDFPQREMRFLISVAQASITFPLRSIENLFKYKARYGEQGLLYDQRNKELQKAARINTIPAFRENNA
jgi:hypothetical protein